jgi:hypothetical protein
LNICYNGVEVWFKDVPQARLYIGSEWTPTMQGGCTQTNTPVDSNNANRLPSITVTCKALFSNRLPVLYNPKAEGDTNGGSEFTIPPLLNFGINIGTSGSVGGTIGGSETRDYTLRIYPWGTYDVSGVGNPGRAEL